VTIEQWLLPSTAESAPDTLAIKKHTVATKTSIFDAEKVPTRRKSDAIEKLHSDWTFFHSDARHVPRRRTRHARLRALRRDAAEMLRSSHSMGELVPLYQYYTGAALLVVLVYTGTREHWSWYQY
jgi:hypothetical protein